MSRIAVVPVSQPVMGKMAVSLLSTGKCVGDGGGGGGIVMCSLVDHARHARAARPHHGARSAIL